mgnify:CR=1 FL=1
MYTGPVALKVSAPGGQADSRVAPLIKAGRNLLGEMESRAQITGPTAMAATRGSKETGTVYARWTPYVKTISVEVVATPESVEDVTEKTTTSSQTVFEVCTEVYRQEEFSNTFREGFTSEETQSRNNTLKVLKKDDLTIHRIVRIIFELTDGSVLEIVTPRGQQLGPHPVDNFVFKSFTNRSQELDSDSNGKPNPDYLWVGGERERNIQPINAGYLGVTCELVFTPERIGDYKTLLARSIQLNTKYDVKNSPITSSDYREAPSSDSLLGEKGAGVPWQEYTRKQRSVTVRGQTFSRTESITFYRFLAEKNENQALKFVYSEPRIDDLEKLDE